MNSVATNVKNAANIAVTNVRNIVAPEQRTSSFYYILIISLFFILGLLTYFYIPIKTFLENIFFSVKNMLFPSVSPKETPLPISPENHPSGPPEADPLTQVGSHISKREEVFHISKNIYTYSDAAAVCKAFGADLATESQVNDAYKKGANWCSYGWIQGQQAVFPTQQSTYDSLQKGSIDHRDSCGKVGLNGGYFDNPDLRFGVTCYGMKPSSTATNTLTPNEMALPPSAEDIEFEKKVQKFRDQLDTTTVDPWNGSLWSSS